MATRLKNLVVNRVDLVDVGANLDLDSGDGAWVKLWKRADGAHGEDAMPDTIEKIGRKMSQARLDRLKTLHSELAALLSEVDDASQEGDNDVAENDTVAKNAIPEDVQKRLTDLEKRAADAESRAINAEAVAKMERDARLLVGFTDKVKLMKNLALDPDKDAALLMKMSQVLTEEEFGRVEEILRAADATISKGGLFEAKGSSAQPRTTSAFAAIETEAKALVAKGGAKTLSEAIEKVAAERPELYAQYVEETRVR